VAVRVTAAASAPRRRDAARSQELLLQAALALFAERGYDGTTVRDIGDRAGVDPALFARYFDTKAGLYLAALHSANDGTAPSDLLDPDHRRETLNRLDRVGPGPVFQSALRPNADPDVQAATHAELYARLVEPLRERFLAAGVSDPLLRAEVAVAAFAGVAVSRRSGALEQLAAASADEVLRLTGALLHSLLET
jgi:AcrR family transcriptional regulator